MYVMYVYELMCRVTPHQIQQKAPPNPIQAKTILLRDWCASKKHLHPVHPSVAAAVGFAVYARTLNRRRIIAAAAAVVLV